MKSLLEIFSKWLPTSKFDQIQRSLQAKLDGLEDMMSRALKLKTSLLFCEHLYGFVWINIGDVLDDHAMQTKMSAMESPCRTGTSTRVRLCLSPALFRFPRTPVTGSTKTMKVDWSGALFCRRLNGQELIGVGQRIPEIVYRAVVLLAWSEMMIPHHECLKELSYDKVYINHVI